MPNPESGRAKALLALLLPTALHLFSVPLHTVGPPMACQMEGRPSLRDRSRPRGGMSGESGQTGGVLHALGVIASPHRALLLTGS